METVSGVIKVAKPENISFKINKKFFNERLEQWAKIRTAVFCIVCTHLF